MNWHDGKGLSLSMVVLHQYHFTNAPYVYFINLILMLYDKHLAIVKYNTTACQNEQPDVYHSQAVMCFFHDKTGDFFTFLKVASPHS